MCKHCVQALTTISPIMKEHLMSRFTEVMMKDVMAFDEPHVPFLVAYEIHAEALKATIDEVLMDDITSMMVSAIMGDIDAATVHSTAFQEEWV